MPDLAGGENLAYLIDAIDTAAGYTQRDLSKYAPHLGVSADVWAKSTAQSLTNIFGNAASLQLSPTKGACGGGEALRKARVALRANEWRCGALLAAYQHYGDPAIVLRSG